MTFVRTLVRRESQNFSEDENITMFSITSDRTQVASGGFTDNWDDTTSGGEATNSNQLPVHLYYYRVRVWTNKPCILYSSVVENYNLAKQAPAGTDTSFNQLNMSNGVIKKWTMTENNGVWAELKHNFRKRPYFDKKKGKWVARKAEPFYLNNAIWKIQLYNVGIEPVVGSYYCIVEAHFDYDATQ